jgi:asparagine synthase (glutamine-hydrolysing)
VIIHLYEEYGEEVVKHLDGMFAFALWDNNTQKVLIARDRFGKKPLYWSMYQGRLYFASELRALIAWPEIRQNTSVSFTSYLRYMLYGYVPSPYAILEHVHKLRPAHLLVFSPENGELHEKAYWDLPIDGPRNNHHLSEEQLINELDDLLREAVRKRLIADVPVGMFLSGGIDSSLIASYIKTLSPNMNVYTIAYHHSDADESDHAQYVADTFNVNLNRVYFDDRELLKQETISIYTYLDEPLADPAIIPLGMVSRVARQDVKVVLSGDGGDELFAGYPKYQAIRYTRWLSYLPKGMINLGAALIDRLPLQGNNYVLTSASRILRSAAFAPEIQNLLIGHAGFSPATWKDLLKRDAYQDYPVLGDISIEHNTSFQQADFINRLLYLDCKVLLPDGFLVKVDRATMANSLEGRTPFLDRDLSRFVMSLPSHFKLKNGTTKYLLKKLAERRLPYEIVHRRKQGFASPVSKWIAGSLKELVGDTLASKALEDYVDRAELETLWNQGLEGDFTAALHIWRIFAFGYFLANLNQGLPLPPVNQTTRC